MENTFQTLGLKPELLKAVGNMGFETPSPIQSKSIPLVLTGKDILGQAQTGTGKTAAYGLPMLNNIEIGKGLQTLIMCPTRELAVQVAQEVSKLGQYLHVEVLPVYGGQSIDHQLRALRKKPEVIVGTPGRIIDHLNRGTIKFNSLQFLILDEADEMLDMGFHEDMDIILKACPKGRQTLLFSATLSGSIMEIARSYMNDPALVAIKGPEATVPQIEQRYYEVNPQQKVGTLCRILDTENPEVCLVFCRTKQGTDELAKELRLRGYASEALHGDLSQRERDSVMQRFRQGHVELLVATDVAARGIDISNVTHVINYDIPQDSDTYIHRIGRTGRAGKEGIAITLVVPREIKLLRIVEHDIKKKITRFNLPTVAEVIEMRQQILVKRIQETLNGNLGEYKNTAATLLEDNDSLEIVASLLKLLDQEGREIDKTELAPTKPAFTKLRIPFGRKHGANPKKIVNLIVAKTRLRPRDVGDIQMFDQHSLVEVPTEAAHQVTALFKRSHR